jgi:hypothetical protein
LLLLAVVFVVSLPMVTTRLYASDEIEYFAYLRSLYFDRDVSFENEYRYFYDRNIARSAGFHETFLERETAAGRRVNYATMGSAVLWLPFYAAADAYTRATGTFEADGFSRPYISAVAYGSALYGFLAILLSIRAARLLLGHELRGSSILAGLAIWIGTPLLFYMYVAPGFAHACSAFAVALFVNVWLRVRERWSAKGASVLGLSVALMAMVREQDAFLALAPAVDFAWTALPAFVSGSPGSRLPVLRTAIVGVVAFLAGYTPQLLAYTALNGYPGPAEHVSRKMAWYSPHALQVLASPNHGFLLWTPLALIAMAGLLALRDTRMRLLLLLAAATQVYVAGSVASWTVAGAFGQRRFVCLTPILVIGLAAVWDRVRGRALRRRPANPRAGWGRLAFGAAVVACIWWNVALMALFATRQMDRQRLELARNAYDAFVTIPLSAPSLAYRYLTDRESFYGPPPGESIR